MSAFDTRTLLLIAHIAGVALLIGPLTVAASGFPGHAARSHHDPAAAGAARAMHRTSRTCGTSSFAVPAIGVALADESNWWSATWLQISIGLTAVGAALLLALVLPLQRQAIQHLDADRQVPTALIGRLHAATGTYSLTWAATLVLMVAKPW